MYNVRSKVNECERYRRYIMEDTDYLAIAKDGLWRYKDNNSLMCDHIAITIIEIKCQIPVILLGSLGSYIIYRKKTKRS